MTSNQVVGGSSPPQRAISALSRQVLAALLSATVAELGTALLGPACKVRACENSLATDLADGYTLPTCALVAQLDRVLDYESRGRGFESSPARHLLNLIKIIWSDLKIGREEGQPLPSAVVRKGVVRQVPRTKALEIVEIAKFQGGEASDPGSP